MFFKGSRRSSRRNSARLRRKRDFASHQHYIETMVVADAGVLKRHGNDLEHYIMTLMSIANRVFSHPSLGSAVAISVVKVSASTVACDNPICDRPL